MRINKKKVDTCNIESLYAINLIGIWRAFKSEHLAFIFLCVYYFLEYIRPQVLYPVLDVLPWALFFLILTLVSRFSDKSVTKVSSPLNKLFVTFMVVIIISSLLAFDPSKSWKYLDIMIGWFVVYFLTISIVNTEKRFFLFVFLYLLFNLKMGQHGALGWLSRGFSFANHGLIGSPGWFRNSGEYAIQMLIFGSLTIAFAVSLKQYWGKYKKILLYIIAAMGYVTVMGASSRGSQLGLLLILIVFSLRMKNGLKGIIIIAFVASILYFILPEEQMSRFMEMGNDNDSIQRLGYWKVALLLIEENPFFGVGYYNWLAVTRYLYPDGMPPLGGKQVVHNIYLECASEMGLIGFFVFLLMIIYAFVINARTRKLLKHHHDRFIYTISYALDAGLIGYLAAGTFVTVFKYPFFWIQIAFIVAAHNVAKIIVKKRGEAELTKQ